MIDLLGRALGGEAESLQSSAALVSILAIVPSAILFIINQWHQNGLLRSEKHRYISDKYHLFLDRCLEHSDLRMQDAKAIPKSQLTEEQIYRRDILFDLLTSTLELAYVTYANAISSHRSRQWRGWEDYILFYMQRPDYREWWIRVLLDGDRSSVDGNAPFSGRASVTQYDLKFEKYMFARLRVAETTEGSRELERKVSAGQLKAKRSRGRPRRSPSASTS